MNKFILNRRRVLTAGAMLPIGLVVEGCSQAEVAQWVAAEQSIGQEFAVVESQLAGMGVNPSAKVTIAGQTVAVNGTTVAVAGQSFTFGQVGTLVGALTSALGAASTAAQGQTVLVQIEAYINAIVPVIWPVVQPLVVAANPGVGLTLGLVIQALPAIEGLLNFSVAFTKTFLSGEAQQLAALAPATAAARLGLPAPTAQVRLTPEQALAILMARAGR